MEKKIIHILNQHKLGQINTKEATEMLLSPQPSLSEAEIEKMIIETFPQRDLGNNFIQTNIEIRGRVRELIHKIIKSPQPSLSEAVKKLIENYKNVNGCGECGEPRFSDFVYEFEKLQSGQAKEGEGK